MSKELEKELSRLQLLRSRYNNKIKMCPLEVKKEEIRAKLIFDYIKQLQQELDRKNKIIEEAIRYISNHYEDRSFDEIHNEMLEILEKGIDSVKDKRWTSRKSRGVDMKYKIGDCIYLNDIAGIITNTNIQGDYIQYGIEKYYRDGYHLAGWDWIKEDEIKTLVDENKKRVMLNDYIQCADEHIKKGYPADRFKLYGLIKNDLI